MGKRKVRRSEISETLNRRGGEDDEKVQEEVGEKGKGGFFACYLLTSLSPRHKGHTYIGFTVNPRRRIRQHNGEIGCGAWRTKSKRPWEMVLCIYGFSTNVAALQFEWAWQHPVESLAVRKAAVAFKSLSGIANKIKLVYTMLTLPAWQSLNLTVNFFSTKYTKHSAGCPTLPDHMRVQVCYMDELPCYTRGDQNTFENNVSDDAEECNGTGGSYVSVEETLENVTPVHDSAVSQNNIEEATPERMRCLDEYNLRQPIYETPVQMEDHRQPFCVSNSPERAISALGSGLYNEVEIIEESSLSPLMLGKDQPSIKNPSFPFEVEVIDVFTPSPEYRIYSRRKKREVSTVYPQIIDLTKSPIFV